jgi:hypothetical protein
MKRGTVAIVALALLMAAAGRTETAFLPEGCRDGITLFCADPSWPTEAMEPAPVRRLAARVPPAPPIAEGEAPAER